MINDWFDGKWNAINLKRAYNKEKTTSSVIVLDCIIIIIIIFSSLINPIAHLSIRIKKIHIKK